MGCRCGRCRRTLAGKGSGGDAASRPRNEERPPAMRGVVGPAVGTTGGVLKQRTVAPA
jgi:hypothetical protein